MFVKLSLFVTILLALSNATTAARRQPKKECGKEATSDRIIGGSDANLQDAPFLALLYFKVSKKKVTYNCGGTLIKTRTVLTAAHCVEGKAAKALKFVRLGEYNTNTARDCIEEECGKYFNCFSFMSVGC